MKIKQETKGGNKVEKDENNIYSNYLCNDITHAI